MLRILAYHRVADPASTPSLDPLLVSATPEVFRRQMLHLRKWYRPVALDDVITWFGRGGAPWSRSVHVTVDDAYRDFGEIAWPILRELGIPVTLFVPTAYVGAPMRCFWWDRLHRAVMTLSSRWPDALQHAVSQCDLGAAFGGLSPREVRAELRTLPHDDAEKLVDVLCREAGVDPVVQHGAPALLDWDELRGLARQGVTFGAHTRSHAALSHLDEQRARAEIRGSLADLRRELGESVCAIAYPYGIHDGTVARIAGEEGCALGLTCQNGMNHPDRTDPLRLCRTNITPRTSPTVFAVRMLPWFVEVDRWRQRHKQIPATA